MMIITRTPLRISFAGGGTDIPAYFEQTPGLCVGTTINKYVYVSLKPSFDHKIRVTTPSSREEVDEISFLKHPIVRACLEFVRWEGSVEISIQSDVPDSGTGLGGSSALTVGLLKALYTAGGVLVSPEELAEHACTIEIDRLGWHIGKQDQWFAACGGPRSLQFSPGDVFSEILLRNAEDREFLQSRLVLFWTGLSRSASDILKLQSSKSHWKAHLSEIGRLAESLEDEFHRNNFSALGPILHHGWLRKREIIEVLDPRIDEWYSAARELGAVGGKLLGAGGGGFMLFYVPEVSFRLISHFRSVGMRWLPFRFSLQGSQVVFNDETE